MKKSLMLITLADLLFILFLAISGMFSGIFARIVYLSAFVIPFALVLLIGKREKLSSCAPSIGISTENALLSLPLLAPTIALVLLISWLTSIILSQFSQNTSPDVSGNIFYLIFLHALLPSVLEEALFRYIPIRYLAPYSKKYAVIISALYFSLVHCNLYQIPYAFAAGLVFAIIDIGAGSILPSVIFHFVNNVISVIWLKYAVTENAKVIYLAILIAAAVVSLVPIIVKRTRYKKMLLEAISQECKQELTLTPIFFVAVALLISVLNLQMG